MTDPSGGAYGAMRAGGGLPAAIANVVVSSKTIKAQYIVAERAKWREKIRDAVDEALLDPTKKKCLKLWLVLKLNTNPFCREDQAIVALVKNLINRRPTLDEMEEVADRVALLLKHDWDRSEGEVGTELTVRRAAYSDYIARGRTQGSSEQKFWSGQLPYPD